LDDPLTTVYICPSSFHEGESQMRIAQQVAGVTRTLARYKQTFGLCPAEFVEDYEHIDDDDGDFADYEYLDDSVSEFFDENDPFESDTVFNL